jgi:hypothetical protein
VKPRVDVLPEAQRALWPELARLPEGFVLYGGTALALRLGHRTSVDFDFFSHDPLDHHALEGSLPWLREGEALQEGANVRTVLVRTSAGSVKVSLFGAIVFGRVGEPERTDDGVLRVASLLDLAGTKVKTLLQRVEAKDYLDVAGILGSGVRLEDVLGAALGLFGPGFSAASAVKALAYFEDGDLATLKCPLRQVASASPSQ